MRILYLIFYTYMLLYINDLFYIRVSIDGTHLGHNLPDRKGNRYCINLVCCAGQPVTEEQK